jgi:predicted metal-dependent RNase
VQVIEGFSAHAGRSELTAHLERCRPRGPLFLVHGDEARAQAFETFLKQRGFPDVRVPRDGEEWKA